MRIHTPLIKQKEDSMALQDCRERCRDLLDALQQDTNNCIKGIRNSLRDVDFDDEEIQEELAKQISLLHKFSEHIARVQKSSRIAEADCIALRSTLNSVELASSTLLSKRTNKIIFSKLIRYSTEYFLNSKTSLGFVNTLLKRTVRELSTPTKVLLGLALVLPIYCIGVPISLLGVTLLSSVGQDVDAVATPASSPTPTANASTIAPATNQNSSTSLLPKHAFDNFQIIMMIALAGALGSMVSIFIRLQDYKGNNDYKGSATPILVGFTKPFIGTAFAVFVFALINSNIISSPIIQGATSSSNNSSELQKATDIRYYFFFAIAFLVGFSERLDRDIVDRAESAVSLKKAVRDDIHKTANATQKTADATQKIEQAIEPATSDPAGSDLPPEGWTDSHS